MAHDVKYQVTKFQSILFHATNDKVVCLVERELHYFEKRKAAHFIS